MMHKHEPPQRRRRRNRSRRRRPRGLGRNARMGAGTHLREQLWRQVGQRAGGAREVGVRPMVHRPARAAAAPRAVSGHGVGRLGTAQVSCCDCLCRRVWLLLWVFGGRAGGRDRRSPQPSCTTHRSPRPLQCSRHTSTHLEKPKSAIFRMKPFCCRGSRISSMFWLLMSGGAFFWGQQAGGGGHVCGRHAGGGRHACLAAEVVPWGAQPPPMAHSAGAPLPAAPALWPAARVGRSAPAPPPPDCHLLPAVDAEQPRHGTARRGAAPAAAAERRAPTIAPRPRGPWLSPPCTKPRAWR